MMTSPVENLFVLSVEAKQNVLVTLNFLALFSLFQLKKRAHSMSYGYSSTNKFRSVSFEFGS